MDPFQVLGIPPEFDVDLADLERRHRELSRALHPDRHLDKTPAERRHVLGRAIETNEALRTLKDPVRRAEALLCLRGQDVPEGQEPKASPELLMEMMEQREALSEARATRDKPTVSRLVAAITARQASTLAALSLAFARAEQDGDGASIVPLLGELRYLARFLDEASAVEDDLGA